MLFISHASADDAFVAELRKALEDLKIPVWVDSRSLQPGGKLEPEIEGAIRDAESFLVVLSPATVNSPWVRQEIAQALKVERRRKADGYHVIPLLLSGLTPGALGTWFKKEPVAITIDPDELNAALPDLLAALGKRLPTDRPAATEPDARLLEELVLELTDPKIETQEGERRATATAKLVYEPAKIGERRVESPRFVFTAPLGKIESTELRWYLETYFIWPDPMAQQRAQRFESGLPRWGQALYQAALGSDAGREAFTAWQSASRSSENAERRFSVQVDRSLPKGSPNEAEAAAGEAATELLALPWELLHDGRAWLFQGRNPVRVRRRLPNRHAEPARPTALPIRILLVSPRPEKDKEGNRIGYIDHRVSARPLVEAVENLGDLARLTILQPPTYGALEKALQSAADHEKPFDVVHFDGHGVYDPRIGLGGLCFEDPDDEERLEERRMDFVDAARLAGLVHEHRIPLVYLDACQTAMAMVDPTASVAGRLLEEGVTSVVAMSHSVLVETARRFVQAFYAELAQGARVGRAMLAGQRALFADTRRGKMLGIGELRLQDWFVPVLYQEEEDPQLITRISPKAVQQLEAKKRRLRLVTYPSRHSTHSRGAAGSCLRWSGCCTASPGR